MSNGMSGIDTDIDIKQKDRLIQESFVQDSANGCFVN